MPHPRALACAAALALGLAALALPPQAAAAPAEVRVVVVTTWEVVREGKDVRGELMAWKTRWPFTDALPFAFGPHALLYDKQDHVLAVVTGMATARAAAAITALGLDPRFDLSHAYWVLAGTAGADPKTASAGSVAWERFVVDGDVAQEVDAREIPPEWATGILPNSRIAPYGAPLPTATSAFGGVVFTLNRGLVDWAYARTRDVPLKDDPVLQKLRAPYAGVGAGPPAVIEGDGLMSSRFWYGQRMTDWAERWVDYWTAGRGSFAMSAEEDTGVMQALTLLAQAGRADANRVLLLRAASDYVTPPPGMSAAALIAQEAAQGLPANPEALNNLYAVASPVVKALAEDWDRTRAGVPGD